MAVTSLMMGGLGMMGANEAAGAAERAAAESRFAGQVARADTSPWRTAGGGAVNQIARLLGLGHLNYGTEAVGSGQGPSNFALLDGSNAAEDQKNAFAEWEKDPGYQWRMDEGIRARDRSAASKGMLLSGAQNKAITNWGQGLASEEYGNYFNRLAALSGIGETAANQGASINADSASKAGLYTTQAGQARQSGYNALASALGRADNKAEKWASRIWGGGMMGG
jgi:hypothetical protein